MKKNIELFVPGRLCLLGEHSDWAGKYRNVNSNIGKGYAIVTGVEEGIYAKVTSANKFIVKLEDESKSFECDMNVNKLEKVAAEGKFFSYMAGVAAVVKEKYNVLGLEIDITKTTIPVKKGLSSSAAICVLVARAFNQVYDLRLNTLGEMELAYEGEIKTPSRCGKLDQACAFGKTPVLMVFDGDKLDIKRVKVGDDFHFVFANLMAEKNTIKILSDLNDCYPFPNNRMEENVHKYLGSINEKNIKRAISYLETGNKEAFGKLMIEAQKKFDQLVAPVCPEELTAPILHKTFKDDAINKLCYGYKGVGSQGDGTIQFLAKSEKEQLELQKYLQETLKMDAYTLTLNKYNKIRKAIIPLAGNGTRMYPITKIIKKAFLPIIDSDGLVKPVVMSLLEELDNAGIQEICLVIDENDQECFNNFFDNRISEEMAKKLSKEALEYEQKIRRIGKKLTFILQKEKLGLGHAVSLCKNFANDEEVLLVLGDQLYKTNNSKSVTTQLLDCYEKTKKLVISVCEVPLENVSRYGILSGNKDDKKDYFDVDKMAEKPKPDCASENLFTRVNGEKKYYSVFGEYILTPSVFKILDKNIKDGKKENGEYQITSVLDEVREKEGMVAFIPDGEMLDVGNSKEYAKTLIKKMKKEYL